jgi:hypothetical protein
MTYWACILASKPGGTLYVGVTNNLAMDCRVKPGNDKLA